MRCAWASLALAMGSFALADPWGTDRIGSAEAQEEPKPTRSARGGLLATAQHVQFEVFFYTTGSRVFPRDAAGEPLDAAKLTGRATFYHPNSPEPWFSRPLHPAAANPGQASESLDLAIDLSTVPPTGARVAFEIEGLPGPAQPAQPAARFTVPVAFVANPAGSDAERPASAAVHGYAPIASTAHYFPLAGFYNTPVGVVWVPAPGYYHVGPPNQYYRPGAFRPPPGWERAHPAPSPSPPVAQSVSPDLSGIHTEYFWHPRAMGEPAAHEAWIRGQLRQKYGRGGKY